MKEFELIEKLISSLPTNDAVVTGAGHIAPYSRWVCRIVSFFSKPMPWSKESIFRTMLRRRKWGTKRSADVKRHSAMAGTPIAALVTIALPRKFDVKFVEAVYAGMSALARDYGVAIVGGETTTNP